MEVTGWWIGIRRMDRVPNARIRELCGVKKGLDERIDESVLRWRGWRGIGSPRECDITRSVDRPRKRWFDTVKEFKEKRFGCQASKENGARW